MKKYTYLLGILLVIQAASGYALEINFSLRANDGSPIANAVITAGKSVIHQPSAMAIMDQVNKAFNPYVLVVPTGTAVEFPNSDQIRHHVYSFSKAKPFELRLYSGSPESPLTFDEAGIVVVGCNIHDNMVGYINVTDREVWAITDKAGNATVNVPAGTTSVYVWHPALSLDAQAEEKIDLVPNESGPVVITLEIDKQPEFPQAIKTSERNKFQRYLDLSK